MVRFLSDGTVEGRKEAGRKKDPVRRLRIGFRKDPAYFADTFWIQASSAGPAFAASVPLNAKTSAK